MKLSVGWTLGLLATVCHFNSGAEPTDKSSNGGVPKLINFGEGGAVVVSTPEGTKKVGQGEQIENWTLMAVIESKGQRMAVFEDFSQPKGHMLFVDPAGVCTDLPKSLEPTWAEPSSLYRGHRLEEVLNSDSDLLAGELLSHPGDPRYEDLAACFPPISKMHVYTFVGTHECAEKLGIFYGGATPNFDPMAYVPAIEKIRSAGKVMDGLVGGWLPVVRFVYPETEGDWAELLIYAPMRVENGNQRVQPVWYRLCRVEGHALKWARYFDSYHPFPPRTNIPAEPFYVELLAMRSHWSGVLESGMRIAIPDQRLADLARHSLVREMMTRIGPFPKYGVFDRGYGGSEHDGFQDTFTADTTAMQEWGLFGLAGQYIDNYFSYFVRDDGSLLYRGPETGQFGRMLTVLAEYANYTGNDKLLLRQRARIDGVTKLLLSLRAKALTLPPESPAHGMIAGWSEADACLDPDPPRYMQPYFGNSTEAARGFRDLGAVWERLGRRKRNEALAAWGRQLQAESVALSRDVQQAIARSILTNAHPVCLPAIAGVKDPFDVACQRDGLDPQFRSYRAYMETLYSGNLTGEQVKLVVNYRASHRDTILGIPTAYGYNTHELAGFLSYGHAFGLLQSDLVREYLVTLYSLMAHQYTRGTWTAPETRNLEPKKFAAPYCSPAQMTVPLLTRWMLVFEDPATEELWLAKGTPRDWLEEGKLISVTNAPTRWGRLDFTIQSHLGHGSITATIEPPNKAVPKAIKLRLRVPEGRRLTSVTLNDKPWDHYDAAEETVTLPSPAKGRLRLVATYQ
jgi:hypothetical protein